MGLATLVAAVTMLAAVDARAQCPEFTSGLLFPIGITMSNQNNLLVTESGTRTANTGRISILDLQGNRRTLVTGLPSGVNDVNDVSGPSGIYIRGRTIYVLIGIGDSVLAGPFPRTQAANPAPSSPLFSSILAIHVSANVENTTQGFTLTAADQQAIANGDEVTLSNGGGDRITVEMVANIPDYWSEPTPTYPANVRGANPFGITLVADQIYYTDGGQNLVGQVDVDTGAISVLATFPTIPNPLFPVGPPNTEAVPTGIIYDANQLFVTLFRGAPFPPGTSVVLQLDPGTGSSTTFIAGLKTAIAFLPVTTAGDTDYYVLQHASLGPFFGSPGLVLRFDTPSSTPTVYANCLARPSGMVRDEATGTFYITEFLTGRIVAVTVAP